MTDLGCEVEPQIAVVGKTVLNEQRDLVAEAKLHAVAQSSGLAEVDQVLEGEGECDRLAEVDLDVLLVVLNVGVLAQMDRAITDVTCACELNTLLGALDCDYFQSVCCYRAISRGTYPTPIAQKDLCISSRTPG